MVDHTPTDGTVLRQPARILADDDMTLGPQGIAEMLSGIPAAVDGQPAAPISPQEIAEMRRQFSQAANSDPHGEFVTRGVELGACVPRLLDAIGALTAKNQRLRDALNTTVQEATAAIDDRLQPEIERLTAENARLTSENAALQHDIERYIAAASAEVAEVERLTDEMHHIRFDALHAKTCLRLAPAPDHFEIVCEALAEIKATIEGEGHPGQTVADIVNGCLAEIAALPHSVGDIPVGWYATQRAKVEAAHVAAKIAKRQAECRNCRDGFPAYASFPNWHICPMCERDCRPAAKDGE